MFVFPHASVTNIDQHSRPESIGALYENYFSYALSLVRKSYRNYPRGYLLIEHEDLTTLAYIFAYGAWKAHQQKQSPAPFKGFLSSFVKRSFLHYTRSCRASKCDFGPTFEENEWRCNVANQQVEKSAEDAERNELLIHCAQKLKPGAQHILRTFLQAESAVAAAKTLNISVNNVYYVVKKFRNTCKNVIARH